MSLKEEACNNFTKIGAFSHLAPIGLKSADSEARVRNTIMGRGSDSGKGRLWLRTHRLISILPYRQDPRKMLRPRASKIINYMPIYQKSQSA